MACYVITFKSTVEYESSSFTGAIEAFSESSLVDLNGEIVEMERDILKVEKYGEE